MRFPQTSGAASPQRSPEMLLSMSHAAGSHPALPIPVRLVAAHTGHSGQKALPCPLLPALPQPW